MLNALIVKFPCLVPSGPPGIVKENILNSTAVELSWTDPREAEQNGKIISYAVIISGNESGHFVLHNFTTSNYSIQVTFAHLRPFSEYNVSVAAATAVGTGPFTTPSIFHTPEDG